MNTVQLSEETIARLKASTGNAAATILAALERFVGSGNMQGGPLVRDRSHYGPPRDAECLYISPSAALDHKGTLTFTLPANKVGLLLRSPGGLAGGVEAAIQSYLDAEQRHAIKPGMREALGQMVRDQIAEKGASTP